jgi:L-iditol 2-dehydrogenase
VEPLACVLRAIRRGGTHVNGSVAVIGLGFIGMMAAQIYQNDGYAVYGLDLDRSRLTLAQANGFVMDAFHSVEDVERLSQTLNRHIPVGKVDVVFLTAVNNKTIGLALSLVRDGGQLIVFTSAPTGTSIDPSQLYFREINLITSYSPALADLKEAVQTIFNHKIDVAPLISHQMNLSEIGQAFELYQSGQAIKVFIRMGESA